ncbi:glycoside hydrolase family 76 protein [Intrasporangium sp. YIM S08009]|uniref:glycoside hydrolase family 76 protein n=1 Tax=Intrasporangium zincisolvens TaxID=3080018 RepID=UPI002B05DB93|nr:glycoside hydrolase family 76 protein [Intrasporangium sp. YIM S08009]
MADAPAPTPAPSPASDAPTDAQTNAVVASARAGESEHSVGLLFARPLAALPATTLARVHAPTGRRDPSFGGLRGPWHYWWQAHHLDAVVDAGMRRLRAGDLAGASATANRADRVLATVRLRNRARWTNDFYDDMAWLALAAGRLGRLHRLLERRRGHRLLRSARRTLTAELRSALTDDAGGGLFWSTERDFKNVPASGPAALHLARLGDLDAARRILDWTYARLWSPDTGLFADGIRLRDGVEVLVPHVWSYNQGTVLGALVTIGDPESLERAAALVAAVDTHLTTASPPADAPHAPHAPDASGGRRVLRTHGAGDGGLFTGILARYLALAADTDQLDAAARATASRLVRNTADALWDGRDPSRHTGLHHALLTGRRGAAVATVFSPDPTRPASEALPDADPLELAPQLQAWTVLEAAARLA